MTQHMWDKTTILNKKRIKQLLSSQFSIDVTDIQFFGEGFDNTVFLINQTWIFRFPHRMQALIAMENEIALLPYLSEKLPFKISAPLLVGHSTADYPYAFSGYKMLPGEMLSRSKEPLVDSLEFAKTLGLWLKSLHALPILDEHISVLKGEHDWRLDVPGRNKKAQEMISKYAAYFLEHGFDIAQLIKKIGDFRHLDISIKKPSYVHGDLYSKHIMIDQKGMPIGLIDWGDLHIGHPGIDLIVGIMVLTQPALDVFLEAYGSVEQKTIRVALFRAYCHSITAFAYFSHIKENSSLLWTKAALHNILRLMEE